MKYFSLILLFTIGFIGCQLQTVTPPPAPAPTVITPPAPPPAPLSACEQAQKRLEQLCLADAVSNQYCCAVVMVTKKGKPFAQFCEEKQAEGVFVNPECLSSVISCDDIDFCTRSE